MYTYENSTFVPASQARESLRAAFIRRTYLHLAGAIGLFTILEIIFFKTGLAASFSSFVFGSGRFGWLGILGGFIICGWLARGMAYKVESQNIQYLGLFLYVLAETIIIAPLLYIAVYHSTPDVLPTAVILTGGLFLGLTATAFITKKDFSFLKSFLVITGFIAIGLIVCSAVIGFNLGVVFSFFMVVVACAAILYDTSKIIHKFNTDQHVAASLELFASIALLFWYILSILSRRR